MTESKASPKQQDWTHLLTDPDLVAHIGRLLQAYRDAAPDKREEALLDAMRQIKKQAAAATTGTKAAEVAKAAPAAAASAAAAPAPAPVTQPPFEPDIFTPSWGQDRRRYPRIKCFIAVELRAEGGSEPAWGNLANVSAGGCYVETLVPFGAGSQLEIGLWANNGKLWAKGVVLSGIVVQTNPCFGVRIKFTDLAAGERETLKFFLKFVEESTKKYHGAESYLSRLQK
jgi:PilZ domain-containing protein